MAYAMVAYYGMSEKVGTISYYDSTGQSDMALTKPYSELTAQQIDAEAKNTIAEAYAMAAEVLFRGVVTEMEREDALTTLTGL